MLPVPIVAELPSTIGPDLPIDLPIEETGPTLSAAGALGHFSGSESARSFLRHGIRIYQPTVYQA